MLFQEVAWWSYRCLRPVGTSPSLTDRNIGCQHEIGAAHTDSAEASGSGVSPGMIGGIAAAVVVLGAGGVFLARRRSSATADDRE